MLVTACAISYGPMNGLRQKRQEAYWYTLKVLEHYGANGDSRRLMGKK